MSTPPPADAFGDVPALPAATVILVRDAEPGGVEVFVLRRAPRSAFAPSMYVFPGGRVDEADGAAEIAPYCDGLDDATASARLGVERGGLAYWVAAVRECFEEAGLLLARRRDGGPPAVPADGRVAVHGGTLSMAQLCARYDVVLDVSAIRYVAHWVTPIGEGPRRFDTRFFLAATPPDQEGVHDDAELDDSRWMRPHEAIAATQARTLRMMPPTIANLRLIADCATAADALAVADAVGVPPRIQPRLRWSPTGRIVGLALPGDADFDDLV